MKEELKKHIEYLPILAALGILAGFGAHLTIMGALIISIITAFFVKQNFIYGPSVILIMALGSFNVYLGGKYETLLGMLFLSGLISIFIKKIHVGLISKKGFVTGIYAGAFLLSLPLVFGQKTFSSTGLFFCAANSPFADINEGAFAVGVLVITAYYYLSKIKMLPAGFLAVLIGGGANYIYKLNLPSIDEGFIKFINWGDFGNFPKLFIFSLIIAIILNTHGNIKAKAVIGCSNMISAMAGSIAGGVVSKGGLTPIFAAIFYSVFFVLLIFFGKYIPQSAIGGILAAKCFEYIVCVFKNIYAANLKFNEPEKMRQSRQTAEAKKQPSKKINKAGAKLIFALCFVSSFCNILTGVFMTAFFSLIEAKKWAKK